MESATQTIAIESSCPPKFHWAFVLILTTVTGGLFGAVWLIVQANWARKLRPGNVATGLSAAYAVAVAVSLAVDGAVRLGWKTPAFFDWFSGLLFAMWIASVYTLRYELEHKPIDMWLSLYLPFLLGPVYFQYRLADYAPSVDGRRSTGSLLGL